MLHKKLLAGLVLFACSSAVSANQPIKIGFITSLSGPLASAGKDQYDAFMMMVEKNGGKLGGIPVEVIVEDDQGKTDVAVMAARRLIDNSKVSMITGVVLSSVMLAINKPISDKEVFLISSNAGPSPIAGKGCTPYTFTVSWQSDQAAEAMGSYAQNKNFKSVSILAPNYQAGKDVVEGFKRHYKKEIKNVIYTPLTQLDFSSELSQIESDKSDALFVFYPGGLGVSFMKQFQMSGLDKALPLLSVYTIDSLSLPAQGEAAKGKMLANFWGPDFDNQANKEFVSDFEKNYNRVPSSYAAQSYDAARLLDVAIKKVEGKIDNKKLFRNALLNSEFNSVRGNFKFNNNQFPIQDWYVFDVANDDQGRLNLRTVEKVMSSVSDHYADQCEL